LYIEEVPLEIPTDEFPIEDIPSDPDDGICKVLLTEPAAVTCHDAYGSVHSSDNGESGLQIPVVDPSRLADLMYSGTSVPIDDPSRLADRLFRYYCHSHGETTDYLLALNEPMLVVDP
jgi:hypothetical protein